MTGRGASSRRRGGAARSAGGCALLLVGILVFTLALDLFGRRLDQRRFPWAYARSGRPTLTGTWVGTLVTAGGTRRGLHLDIRLEPLDSGRRRSRVIRGRGSKLEGEARLCGGRGREARFTFTGDNEDAAASRFHLGLYPADADPPDGLAPSHLRGRWDGRDSLVMEADVHLRRGASAISSTDDPDTGPPAAVRMARGDEAAYRALCERLAARRR